jgi:WS/DGAT C-terminal domain
MVATNVAAPDHPLYLLGREILTYFPYVPIGDFMGVCCAMASYNGTFYFSLTGDCASAPDLDRLRDFLNQAFQELREAVVQLRGEAERQNRAAVVLRPPLIPNVRRRKRLHH